MTSTAGLSDSLSPETDDGPGPILPAFDDADLFHWLIEAEPGQLDRLPFGVISMAVGGIVEHYNLAESRYAGLTPARVIGRNFFTSVGSCTNNFMVAERYATEPDLDATIDYVFTFRIAPQRVRLRMLRRAGAGRMFLAVIRRA